MDELYQAGPADDNAMHPDKAFELLSLRYLDGLHNEEEVCSLNEQLASSAEKRELFVALSVEMGMLCEMSLATRHDESAERVSASEPLLPQQLPLNFGGVFEPGAGSGSVWPLPRMPMQLLFVGVLLVGGIVGWTLHTQIKSGDLRRSDVTPIYTTPAAYLTSANGCDWGAERTELWSVGHSVNAGDEITLHEGIADFRLACGVTLSIEGPAALVLNSPTSVVVQHGRFTARVPWEVTDFKVLASTCRISACDTEFGGNVAGSDVSVHVFRGEAIVSSSPFDAADIEQEEASDFVDQEQNLPSGSWFTKVRVSQGRGLSLVSSEGAMQISRWQSAKELEFAAKQSMAGLLPVSPAYISAVLESKPIGYWRFESQKNGRVECEVSANALQIVGSVHFPGDSENRLVELGRPDSDGHLVSSEPLNALAGKSYSVEVWIKPSHSHQAGLVSLVANPHNEFSDPDPESMHAFSLDLTGARSSTVFKQQGLGYLQRSRIRFLHRDPPGGDHTTGSACFSANPYMYRRWQQIVAVKQGQRMQLYVDGKLSATNEDPTFLARNLYLEIGAFVGTRKTWPFVGQIDELSIYNRALSNDEIQQHYRCIRWAPRDRRPRPSDEV